MVIIPVRAVRLQAIRVLAVPIMVLVPRPVSPPVAKPDII